MPPSKPYRTNRMTLGLDLGRKTRFQGYPASRRESTAAASRKCCELGKSKRLGRIAKLIVWLVYELFRGAITAKELDWSEAQIREFVATRKTANPHLCVAVGIVKGGDMPRGG
jgi:hypothetical protein